MQVFVLMDRFMYIILRDKPTTVFSIIANIKDNDSVINGKLI